AHKEAKSLTNHAGLPVSPFHGRCREIRCRFSRPTRSQGSSEPNGARSSVWGPNGGLMVSEMCQAGRRRDENGLCAPESVRKEGLVARRRIFGYRHEKRPRATRLDRERLSESGLF